MNDIRLFRSMFMLLAIGRWAVYSDEPSRSTADRVVFFGDSITQNGLYISYVDAILRIRHPDSQHELINHGISSETISGTSEPDHEPRRPDAHQRFDRDVLAWKPDRVVACFGMNDGNYFPPDEERFGRFRDGVERLVERVKAIPSRLVLVTPPPYDAYRRQVGDAEATTYGYKFPAIHYDETLRRFAEWERTRRDEPAVRVVDLHSRVNEHLRQRRLDQVSFFLAGDGVHPGETGHLLMALALVETLEFPEDWAVAEVDSADGRVLVGDVTNFERDARGVRFTWTRPLPIPMDSGWDLRSLTQEKFPSCLGHERLLIRNLPEGRYELTLSGEGRTWRGDRAFRAEELNAGLDLGQWWPALPLQKRADKLLAAVVEARRTRYDDWRRGIEAGRVDPAERWDVRAADHERLRRLAKPGRVEVRLRRVGP